MKGEHFGSYLRQRREAKGLSLADLSRTTKIKERTLELLEESRLESLPPRVFVAGYISAYAREVRADERHALARFHEQMGTDPDEQIALADWQGAHDEEPSDGVDSAEGPETMDERPRLGMALVVFLILVVATLTLSLLLRHGAQPGDGISLVSSAAVAHFV